MEQASYFDFENKFRGPRDEIKNRLSNYQALLDYILSAFDCPKLLDIGCGRGEWLEICNNKGIKSFGIEKDDGMYAFCRGLKLDVIRADALKALSKYEKNSFQIISAFHLIEHLDNIKLDTLIQECQRILEPGGVLILETPSIDNLKVSTKSFYLDPTHINPINPDGFIYRLQAKGFDQVKYFLINGGELVKPRSYTLSEVLDEVAQDVVFIATIDNEQQSNLFSNEASWKDQLNIAIGTVEAFHIFDEKILGIEQKMLNNQQKIGTIEPNLLTIENKISDVEKRSAISEQKITPIETKIVSNQEKIVSNEEKLKLNETKIISNQENVIVNDKKIRNLTPKILTLGRKILSLGRQILTIEQKITAIEEKILAIEHMIHLKNEGYDNEVNNFKNQIEFLLFRQNKLYNSLPFRILRKFKSIIRYVLLLIKRVLIFFIHCTFQLIASPLSNEQTIVFYKLIARIFKYLGKDALARRIFSKIIKIDQIDFQSDASNDMLLGYYDYSIKAKDIYRDIK